MKFEANSKVKADVKAFDGFKQETDDPNQIETVYEGKKINKINCEFCDATFENHLKNHVSTLHEGKKSSIYKCVICDEVLTSKGALKTKHIAAVHDGKKPYECEICNSIRNSIYL